MFTGTKRGNQNGFTLIEMLVVMSIMMIITLALLVNQQRFDSSTVLRSLAYSVALSVRQAQVYGTSVLGTTTSSCVGGFTSNGQCFASAYGLHFDSSIASQYLLFADLDGNLTYSTSPLESIKAFNFSNGYIITGFCVSGTNSGSSISRCSYPTASATINTLDILFKRPNPDATFTALFNGSPIAGDRYSSAYIKIQATGDSVNTKSINILSTGEVSVCTKVGC